MLRERSKAPGAGSDGTTAAGQRGPATARKKLDPKRAAAKERLERNLKSLGSYCQRPVERLAELDVEAENANSELAQWLATRRVLWPPRELLRQINHDVIKLAMVRRKKPILPIWKAFEQVDKRMRKLGLLSRLNDLVRCAEQRLAGESELGKAAQEPDSPITQCLLGDILCGVRSLERLLKDDRRRIEWKTKACPLVQWLITIGHSFAKKNFGPVAEHYVLDAAAWQERKRFERREKARTRIRRHRKKPVEKALHDLGRTRWRA